MDSNGLHAQADTLIPFTAIPIMPEASLDMARPVELVDQQSPKTRGAFLRSLQQVERFAAVLGGAQMRAYQRQVAQAVTDSVLTRRGLSLVVMFPRQSGKNFCKRS